MSTMNKLDETRIAEEIVSVLPAGTVARVCSDDRESIRFAVRGGGIKLHQIILNRISLRRLAADPLKDVKVEYLQRDLAAAMASRREFRYPRVTRVMSKVRRLLMPRLASAF